MDEPVTEAARTVLQLDLRDPEPTHPDQALARGMAAFPEHWVPQARAGALLELAIEQLPDDPPTPAELASKFERQLTVPNHGRAGGRLPR